MPNDSIHKSIEILRSTADSIALASALLNAGDTYYNMGRYEDALRCFEEAGPIFKENELFNWVGL